jgi:hypothetical protein
MTLNLKKCEVSAKLLFTQGCFLPRIYQNLLDNWTPGMCLQYAVWFLWKTGKELVLPSERRTYTTAG